MSLQESQMLSLKYIRLSVHATNTIKTKRTAQRCDLLTITQERRDFVEKAWGRPAPFAASFMAGQEDKKTNNRTMLPALKNNAAAGYQGPMKR